jgi:hypothetical protein
MSFLSHTWKGQQAPFRPSRAKSAAAVTVRAWRFDSPIIKELCKIVLTLVIYFAIVTGFVAVGVWIWVPYSQQ